MKYYVYENPRLGRGRVHRADCGFCQNKEATLPASPSRNGTWHGPFNRCDAFAKIKVLGVTDIKACSACDP